MTLFFSIRSTSYARSTVGFTQQGPGSCGFPASRRGERGQCCLWGSRWSLGLRLCRALGSEAGRACRPPHGQAAGLPLGPPEGPAPGLLLLALHGFRVQQESAEGICGSSDSAMSQTSAHGKVGKSSRDKPWKVRPRLLPHGSWGRTAPHSPWLAFPARALRSERLFLWGSSLRPTLTAKALSEFRGFQAFGLWPAPNADFGKGFQWKLALCLWHLRFPEFYCSPVKLLKICWVFLILQDRALSGSSLASQPLDQARKQQFSLKEKKTSLPYLRRT